MFGVASTIKSLLGFGGDSHDAEYEEFSYETEDDTTEADDSDEVEESDVIAAPDDVREIDDLTEITGIGETRANDLEKAGLPTASDVYFASDDVLTAIDGIGEYTVEQIRDDIGGHAE